MEVISKAFFHIIMTLDHRGSNKKPISRTTHISRASSETVLYVLCHLHISLACGGSGL